MNFNHSTKAENIAELRRRFKAARGIDACKIARWLYHNVTLAQLKAVFNLTDAQVAVLRTKLITMRDKLVAVEESEGE